MPAVTHSAPAASASRKVPPTYRVGRDAEGHWVAVEAGGRAGGLFRTRADALHFASIENGCRPDAVAVAAGPIRFRI